MAQRLSKQSILGTKPDAPRWVLTKIAGTSTPYIARLFAGVLQLRDQTNRTATQGEEVDNSRRVSQGEIPRVAGNSIHVDESGRGIAKPSRGCQQQRRSSIQRPDGGGGSSPPGLTIKRFVWEPAFRWYGRTDS